MRRSNTMHETMHNPVEQALAMSKEKFISGSEIKKQHYLRALSYPDEYVRFTNTIALKSKLDSRFKRNAHVIPGTNMVAATGPQLEELEEFLKDTVLNQAFPIYHVIALGYGLINFPTEKATTRTFSTEDARKVTEDFINYESIDFEIENFSEKSSLTAKAATISIATGPVNCAEQNAIVREIDIQVCHENTQTNLRVTNFELPDNDHFDVITKGDFLKIKLWNLFLKTLTQNVLIHCHAGLGRTGHLIFLFEMLKRLINNTEEKNKDPAILHQQFEEIKENMRTVRPALLLEETQFTEAVRTAFGLHRFALENKYVTQEVLDRCHLPETKVSPPPSQPTVSVANKGLFSCNKTTVAVAAAFVVATVGAVVCAL